jgi:hypothetical protein
LRRNAIKKIIKFLKYNVQINQIVKNKIKNQAIVAQIKISNAFRRKLFYKYTKYLKSNDKYLATLYLDNEGLEKFNKVEIFGEFSAPSQW